VPQHKPYIDAVYVKQALDLLAKIAAEESAVTADTGEEDT